MIFSALLVISVIAQESLYQASVSEFLLNQFMSFSPEDRTPPELHDSLMLYSVEQMDDLVQ